ncbi:hypothetical protein [Microbacterium paludicola]|uniref:DUF7455 domain-containing protein n=1 Tax=Microbacterium paludicola TaxID=300019 RepID=UPI0011A7C93C|nr:hypothetical protein [Microbacterium paludicola]
MDDPIENPFRPAAIQAVVDTRLDGDDIRREAERRMTYCDGCGTGTLAKRYILLPYTGGVLKFCRHHTAKHWERLNAEGAFIYRLTRDAERVRG